MGNSEEQGIQVQRMNDALKDILVKTDSLLIGYSGRVSKPLLPPVSFSAGRGEMIAVAGRNGSGKSTLLKTLAGILKPLGGTIYIDGKDMTKFKRTELALKTGFVATGDVKVPGMKVSELVKLGRYPHTSWTGTLDDHDYSRVEYAIESTGLRNLCERYVEELSDGERQRAMIGRVVAQDTPLIILDEPTAFLDIKSRYEITDLLRRLAEEEGRTVIFSTHDLQSVFGICGRMLLLTEKEVAEGAPEDLALNGTLNLLFDDPGLKFNPEDATVSFLRQMTGTVQVKGAEGAVRLWTCRTVQRTGFHPVSTEAPLRIEIRDGSQERKWICRNKENSEEVILENLYDTGKWLGEQKKQHDRSSQRLNFL